MARAPRAKRAARIGLFRPTPLISLRLLVPIWYVTMPARRNNVALSNAWFQMWKMLAENPAGVRVAIPSSM
jgi:hypothetical protein